MKYLHCVRICEALKPYHPSWRKKNKHRGAKALREERVQEEIARIRADPRWEGEPMEDLLDEETRDRIFWLHGNRYKVIRKSDKKSLALYLASRYGISCTAMAKILRGPAEKQASKPGKKKRPCRKKESPK